MVHESGRCQSSLLRDEKSDLSKFCKESYDDWKTFFGSSIDFPKFWTIFSKRFDGTNIDDEDKLEYWIRKMNSRTTDSLNRYEGFN